MKKPKFSLEKVFNSKPEFSHVFIAHPKEEPLGKIEHVRVELKDGQATLTGTVIIPKDKVKMFKKIFGKQ